MKINLHMDFNLSTEAGKLLKRYELRQEKVDFQAVSELAQDEIEDVLEHFAPGGEINGNEYIVCNPTRDDGEPGSFKFNIKSQLWAEFAGEETGGDVVSYVKHVGGYDYMDEAALEVLRFLASTGDQEVALPDQSARSNLSGDKKQAPRASKATPSRGRAEGPVYVMPVPDDLMERKPAFFSGGLGRPTMSWEYRDQAGQLLFIQQRFETPTGKTYRPLCCVKDASGYRTWELIGPPSPRPAYGLDRLAARPDAPVLFVEGEKSADAAQRLFPDFVAVTTMNGAKSPEKTDFRPFSGRSAYIARDNDEAGKGYESKLCELLGRAGSQVVATMNIEMLRQDDEDLPKGYDLADAEQDGWTSEKLKALGDQLWIPYIAPGVNEVDAVVDDADHSMAKRRGMKSQPTKKGLVLQAVQSFASEYFDGHLVHFNSRFLAYERGAWRMLDLSVDIEQRLLNDLADEASSARLADAVKLLRTKHARLPDDFQGGSSLICLNNGTLDPMAGELLPHSPDHCLMNRLDIDFDPVARCPAWLAALNGIFLPDADREQRIQFLQEYIGYLLIPDTRMHKFLWLVGAGGNGKSLILQTIEDLVGRHNISNAAIERLDHPAVRAELQGKLVNISSEMSAKATVSDSYLKQIVSGDTIEAERKFEAPFSFKPHARLIAATNVLPRLLDHSDGFARRAIILRLGRQFTDGERDARLPEKLKAERAGILVWALSGLRQLLERGEFVIPPSSVQEVAQYRVNSDPIRQYADQHIMVSDKKSEWIGGDFLYKQYREWARDNGYQPCASNQFAERLQGLGFRKVKTRDGSRWQVGPLSNQPETSTGATPESPLVSSAAANYIV